MEVATVHDPRFQALIMTFPEKIHCLLRKFYVTINTLLRPAPVLKELTAQIIFMLMEWNLTELIEVQKAREKASTAPQRLVRTVEEIHR